MFNTLFCSNCGALINNSCFECSTCGKVTFHNGALTFATLETPTFDRFDICEAYRLIETDYNVSGILQERKSNDRRHKSTDYQLHRMRFVSVRTNYYSLSDNAKLIYHGLQLKYGFLKSKITRIDVDPTAIVVYRNGVKRSYAYSEKRANCIMAKTFSSFPYSRKQGSKVILTTKNCFI